MRAKTVYDTASDVVDTISLDTMSVSSFGDDEDEDSVASSPSLSGSALRLLSPCVAIATFARLGAVTESV